MVEALPVLNRLWPQCHNTNTCTSYGIGFLSSIAKIRTYTILAYTHNSPSLTSYTCIKISIIPLPLDVSVCVCVSHASGQDIYAHVYSYANNAIYLDTFIHIHSVFSAV